MFQPRAPSAPLSFSPTRRFCTLARSACVIEHHYGVPMDMEWAKDGRAASFSSSRRGRRPCSHGARPAPCKTYRIMQKGRKLASGLSIGDAVVAGRGLRHRDRHETSSRFVDGAVLVTATTDPDWVPIMKRAAAIVTDHGGRTSHAAIVSRELGVPAIVGTGNATQVLHDEQYVTVSCAEGDEGFVYEGIAEFETEEIDVTAIPATAHQDHAQPGQSGGGVSLVAAAGGRGGACPHGVRDQQSHQGPSHGACPFRRAEDEEAKRPRLPSSRAGYEDKADYFVDRLSPRARAYRRRLASEARDRPHERLQDQ